MVSTVAPALEISLVFWTSDAPRSTNCAMLAANDSAEIGSIAISVACRADKNVKDAKAWRSGHDLSQPDEGKSNLEVSLAGSGICRAVTEQMEEQARKQPIRAIRKTPQLTRRSAGVATWISP